MHNEQPGNKHPRPTFDRRLLGLVVAAVGLLALLLGRPFAASGDNTLFAPATGPDVQIPAVENALRVRAARINWVALQPETGELRLNLFDDADLTARLWRVDQPPIGGYVWVGSLVGEPDGYVTLSVVSGVLSGSVYRSGREWAAIRAAEGGLYTIAQVDPAAPQPSGQDVVVPPPPPTDADTPFPQGATCQEDGSVVTVMVVYTPAARDAAGGQAAVEALISQRISEMNTANALSAVVFDWQLAHVAEVNYTESGNILADLQNLQGQGDGLLDGVFTLRDAYKADLVAMLIAEGNGGMCGRAYHTEALDPWYEGFGFGVSALDYPGSSSCSPMTLTHELGHNLGNAHDRAHATETPLFPYAYGYQSPNQTFHDIMSYDCPGGCQPINQWANPDVWYGGEPTGVEYEADPAHAADIVRSMNQFRTLVANYRPDCTEPTATPTATATDVPLPTDTPTPTNTPTQTLIPTDTPTPTQTLTPTRTPSPTITPTGTQPTPTRTPTPTATSRATRTPSPTATSGTLKPATQLLYMPAVIRK